MAAGEPLLRPAVAPPPLVSAGGPVSLEWVRDGVRVTLSGVALHAARAHEIVRVRLDEGRAVRTARVTGPGTAVLTEVTR
jgi:flagella basal body P-ring formation protein FlgA